MNLLNKCILVLLFVVLPILVGGIYSPMLLQKKNIMFADMCKLLIQTWLYGLITMFAVMQLIAIPMIAQRTAFSLLVNVWSALVAILAVAGTAAYIVAFVKNKRCTDKELEFREGTAPVDRKRIAWIAALGVIFVLMTAFQARVASKYQHTDDDDARFVALELIAVENDEMLTLNPIDGYPMYWNTGEVKKDYTSPWTMYVAACSRISGIHPAALSHRMLPMFMIPICYLAYLLLGLHMFGDDWEKTFIFMIIVSVVNMFGYTSTHTVSSLLLLRIWQGKAVFAGLMIPVILDLLYRLYDNPGSAAEKILLFVSCMASSLMSGGGIVISAMAVAFYGLIVLVRHKSIKNTVLIWLTCTPCVVYSLCNVFWYQVFKIS